MGIIQKLELLLLTVSVLMILDTLMIRSIPYEVTTIETVQDSHLHSKLKLLQNPPSSTNPRQVLLLAYQRTGSSFLGHLFNDNPDAFHVFEPVDGIYCAMYGTAEGWNVPSDIFNYWNGSFRHIPEKEGNAIAETLENFYQCNIRAIPTEVLAHKFWTMWMTRQKSLANYVKCFKLIAKEKKLGVNKCRDHIKTYCPTRFGANLHHQDTCRTLLWDVRQHPSDYSMTHLQEVISKFNRDKLIFDTPKEEVFNSFENYHHCMLNLTKEISACIPHMQKVCDNSIIRSIKTVRVTMDTAWKLLQRQWRIQVLHLLRDPKPVTVSRLKQVSFRGSKSGRSLVKEAILYCSRIVHDVNIRKRLELKYPYTFRQIIYEDFVTSPLNHTISIYNTISVVLPDTVKVWLKDNTVVSKNSTTLATSWVKNMTYDVVLGINRVCKSFYKNVTFDWL